MEYTQLQWRFQAVLPTVYFPHGVQTTYRRFSAENCVIIEKKIKFLCTSPVGRKTGLDATNLRSYWYPSIYTIPNRPVEGFFLLNTIPYLPNDSFDLPPMALHTECINKLTTLKSKIMDKFNCGTPARAQWAEWFEENLPR
jgi:hypothetical protein